MSLKVFQMLQQLMKVNRSTLSKGRMLTSYVGKAKDYPGAANLVRGMKKKGKPKLRIV